MSIFFIINNIFLFYKRLLKLFSFISKLKVASIGIKIKHLISLFFVTNKLFDKLCKLFPIIIKFLFRVIYFSLYDVLNKCKRKSLEKEMVF